MFKLLYNIIDQLPSEKVFVKKLNSLPEPIADTIKRYKNYEDQVLRLAGKLLLKEGFKEYREINNTKHLDVIINEHGKPFIENNTIHFSTAYAGNIAVCIISTNGETGIDIEKLRPVELSLYKEYFTLNEWQYIILAKDTNETYKNFYHLWTRKEAILKASGVGLSILLNTIEVLNETLILNNKKYYLKTINLSKDYICHIVTESLEDHVTINEINIF